VPEAAQIVRLPLADPALDLPYGGVDGVSCRIGATGLAAARSGRRGGGQASTAPGDAAATLPSPAMVCIRNRIAATA